nr:hypothetical protein BaRGS_022401 [Batillaria attramentaria]
MKADEKLVSLVALLDLSAAFDTLDHSILLKRLEITFGLRGTVLRCFCKKHRPKEFQLFHDLREAAVKC